MNVINGVIEPSAGDVYHFETLAELDDYIEYEDTGQAKRARTYAVAVSVVLVILLALVLFVVRESLFVQLLVLLTALSAWGSYYLYELLELCDD